MIKCIFLSFVILLLLGVNCKNIYAETEITGEEFVKQLVEFIGLGDRIKEGATANDYINILKEVGIVFPEDFDHAKPITKELKAELLSRVFVVKEEISRKEETTMEIYRNKAVIIGMSGDVMVKYSGTDLWIPAKINMELKESDSIKTGVNSSVLLRVGVAGRIEIKENSELFLKNISTQADRKAETILIYLAMGELSVDVRFIDKNTAFEVHTPTTVAAVRGTIYVVTVRPTDGKTEIREGK